MTNIVEHCYSKFKNIVESRNLLDGPNRFLLFFSCGKDCTMLLDLLLRYVEENNISAPLEVFSVAFPKHMYFDGQQEKQNYADIKQYWQQRNVDITYVVPTDDDFADDDKHGCSTCKKARKAVIDPFVNDKESQLGIFTGFTMYDALAYLDMLMIKCHYNLANINNLPEPQKSITTKMLHKISLKEHLPNNKYMIRPIVPFNEMEVEEYLRERNIPYLTTPCKISGYKFKRQYSRALKILDDIPSYEDIEQFLLKNGIEINNNGLSFDDVVDDNFFIDC